MLSRSHIDLFNVLLIVAMWLQSNEETRVMNSLWLTEGSGE